MSPTLKQEQHSPLAEQSPSITAADAFPSPTSGASSAYRRASRKNAPKRWACEFAGCNKIYTRAEHLQRHQLNHEPKGHFSCDVPGCDQKFVRADLLARHKKRHSATYVPRNRAPTFNNSAIKAISPTEAGPSPIIASDSQSPFAHPASSVPHDAAILLTPDSVALPPPAPSAPLQHGHSSSHHGGRIRAPTWSASVPDISACNVVPSRPAYFPREQHTMENEPSVLSYSNAQFPAHGSMSRENFAVWLFDPQPTYSDFSVANLPFLEGGLESPFNANIHYDYESLTSTSRSQLETPPRQLDGDESRISEFRRHELLRLFQAFRRKQPKSEPQIANLVHDSGGDLPALNLEMMRDCLQEFWDHISPRVPIIHQPTFSCNRCPILLLLVMIALGAASLRSRDTSGNLADYGGFADVIVTSARFELLTAEDASPPVALYVAQALLLLEFYEKMYSSRPMHERAHIYHSVALTLLRRGSPLIGRSGSESPPDLPGGDHMPHNAAMDSRTWWIRWAETEAMHRVVYAAFCFDITHAAMFGHVADMAPNEIRLPLPCDDNLWTASKPDDVRQMDANLRMYGVKPISFLDGLKKALHGKEVRTHSFGRMIIMSGLLSVGWHLSHRETHLKSLDLTTPSNVTQEGWRLILLKAFDEWKDSFDTAQGQMDHGAQSSLQRNGSNGPIQSPAILYHLANISLHVDIIDCQVFSGARRLLGRKVSTRDYENVAGRMKAWATLASTRHAILHAFRLLQRVLVEQKKIDRRRLPMPPGSNHLPPIEGQTYSLRNEPDPHRPWIMYYAALSIWSYVRALNVKPCAQNAQMAARSHYYGSTSGYHRMSDFLDSIAQLPELTEAIAPTLADGLPELLSCLNNIFQEAHWELLREACERLRICREILIGNNG